MSEDALDVIDRAIDRAAEEVDRLTRRAKIDAEDIGRRSFPTPLRPAYTSTDFETHTSLLVAQAVEAALRAVWADVARSKKGRPGIDSRGRA